uniref:Uncharacterized protein n=1 Tax=Medicago truncatula TaxID=3880 RepID=I3RZT2_MEDTR|nr:unknown [Medicago truncatula]
MGTLNWLQSWLPLTDLSPLMQLKMARKDRKDGRIVVFLGLNRRKH